MKRFVLGDIGIGVCVAIATLAVVAATGASAGATYLIVLGFLTIAIIWRRFHEPPETL
jgi:hypothetical protein